MAGVNCILSDEQKLTALKGSPHVSSKGGSRGLLRSAAGLGCLLLSLNSNVAQGKAFGPQSQTHWGQDLIPSSVKVAHKARPRAAFLPCKAGLEAPPVDAYGDDQGRPYKVPIPATLSKCYLCDLYSLPQPCSRLPSGNARVKTQDVNTIAFIRVFDNFKM